MPKRSTFGTIRELPSGRYQVVVPIRGGGREPLGTFESRKLANRAKAEAEARFHQGRRFDPKQGEIFFAEYAHEYVKNGGARGTLAPRTKDLYEELIAGVLEPWSRVMLADITSSRVRAWRRSALDAYAERARAVEATRAAKAPTGERRVEQGHLLMKAVLNMALMEKRVESNEAVLPKLARVKRKIKPLMTVTELDGILGAVAPHLRVPVAVAASSGARISELIALEVRDFDSAKKMLVIERQTTVHSGGTQTGRGTKAQERRRVPLTGAVTRAIEEVLHARGSLAQTDVLFLNRYGQPLTKNALELAWRRARAEANVDERLTFHSLRAMYLTAYTAAGAPMPLVMARGGHSSVKAAMEYQRNLSDLSGEEKRDMVDRLVSKRDRKEFGR